MTLFLLDGKNLVFRYGHVMNRFENSDGHATGVLYGVTRLLLQLKRKFPDAKFAYFYDGNNVRKNGWRCRVYPQYKMRAPIQDSDKGKLEIINRAFSQVDALKEILSLIDIPWIEVPHAEADDLIALAAVKHASEYERVIIYSTDKDFLQLTSKKIKVMHTNDKSNIYAFADKQYVENKFGCTVQELLLVRSLLGDGSDHIPKPLHGMGPVGAVRLVRGGINPAFLRWDQHARSIRRIEPKLERVWGQVHINYQLMKLPPDDHTVDKEMRAAIVLTPKNISANASDNRRKVVSLLGKYELSEVIAKRNHFLSLQKNLAYVAE